MIGNFIQLIDLQKPSHGEVLKHINSHKLIDMLMVQGLKYRVQFLFNDNCGIEEELNESSLLNGSVNCSYSNNNFNNNQNPHIMTNR